MYLNDSSVSFTKIRSPMVWLLLGHSRTCISFHFFVQELKYLLRDGNLRGHLSDISTELIEVASGVLRKEVQCLQASPNKLR